MKMPFTKDEVYQYLGVLLLLGIHKVRNQRYAWSSKKAQVLVCLGELMTCYHFEIISAFLHIVTPNEEQATSNDRLRKIRTLHNHIKNRCSELYQPLQQLSVVNEWLEVRQGHIFVSISGINPLNGASSIG